MMSGLLRVLVIDDDEDDYVMIRDMLQDLEAAPVSVDWASTYETGLEALRQANHDVYLLDYRLGSKTGIDLFREFKSQNGNAAIILMSGQGNESVDMTAMRAGFSDYIPKGRIEPLLLEHSIRYAIMRNLMDAEQRLAAIVESSHDAVIRLDLDGNIRSCNGGAFRVFGLLSPDYIGRPIAMIETPESAGVFASLLDRVLNGEEADRAEVSALKIDGEQIVVSAQVSEVRDELGNIEGFSVIAHDITELKNAQLQRDNFVSVASHELRTPMTSILGFAELLITRTESVETWQNWAGLIHKDGLRMMGIINDMLDVTRIIEDKDLHREPINVLAALAKTVEEARTQVSDRMIILKGDSLLPDVDGDAEKFMQIFSNLLTNAIKYSPNGGDIIVNANNDATQQRVVITVSDSGIGIAEEDQNNIYKMFFRAKREETASIVGTGIGLSIVKRLVERMNGKIWVESELDQGSTFYVTFPIEASMSDPSLEQIKQPA